MLNDRVIASSQRPRGDPVGSLRRLHSGAVLTLGLASALACSGGDNNPAAPTPPDQGHTPTAGCSDGVLPHGALYRVCFPASWNGNLVLYAHGYVRPGLPVPPWSAS